MRKLLNTLYILSNDLYLSLENHNVVVQRNREEISRYPLHTLESICVFSRKGISIPLIAQCCQDGIPIFIMSNNGTLLARISLPSQGNILLRKEQYRIADDPHRALEIGAIMIRGKIENMKHQLDRFRWAHEKEERASLLEIHSNAMDQLAERIGKANTAAELLGIEGEASALYFSCFDSMILNPDKTFFFHVRSRHPPLNPTNAMLSFAYTLLTNECAAALESVGLDASAGFLHQDHPGRKSLACDLLEELRQTVSDRFVLRMVNQRVFSKEHFEQHEEKGIYLNNEGRRLFLQHWQKEKQEQLTHHILKEHIPAGLIPYAQAKLLASYIRGDSTRYHVFVRR